MPTYEYACRACGEHLEVVQSFSEDALTTCPNCAGELRKVYSAAGIIFKGSGWHVKDYASSGRNGSADAGAGSASSGSESGTKDSDKGSAKTSSESSSGSATEKKSSKSSDSSTSSSSSSKGSSGSSSTSSSDRKSA